MDKITEVGHKMRSAIKAKLIELGCYVDDELPDYIMVMVANHRSKEMMLEDLQLFLDDHTEVFVNWLHQVLQKLHEVTVNNIDIPKIAKQEARLKRKMVESKSNRSEKKEKVKEKEKEKEKDKDKDKDKSKQKKIKKEKENKGGSLTDEIPVSAKTIVERRISLNKEKATNAKPADTQIVDQFDIPSVSEVDKLELAEIETKIEAAKRKLALLESEVDDSDFINIKADEEFFENEFAEETVSNKSKVDPIDDVKSDETIESRTPPRKVTIRSNDSQGNTPIKTKPSVMDRLGERPTSRNSTEKITERKSSPVRKKIRLSEIKRVEEELLGIANSSNKNKKTDNNKKTQKPIGSHHDRSSGLMSHVIPVSKSTKRSKSPSSSPPPTNTSLPSVVQIKPRKLPPQSVQPNKNLLLKAVAEAQKSVSAINLDVAKDKINHSNMDDDSHLSSSNKKELFTARYKKSVSNISKDNIKNIVIKVQSDNTKNHTESDKSPVEKQKKTELDLLDASMEQDTDDLDYIPTNIELCENDQEEFQDNIVNEQKPRFIVTLNGLDESIFKSKETKSSKRSTVLSDETNENSSLVEQKEDKPEKKNISEKKHVEVETPKKTRKPSPIVFNKSELEKKDDSGPPLPLPKVYPTLPLPLKVKERCKYWPGCRLGDTCEYVHPSQPCKMFPLCKFGDRCLYIHPPCKFDIACSRRGCPYTHCYTKPTKMPLIASTVVSISHSTAAETTVPTLCKYYPNCSNVQCSFYHPKPCRFGKYCLNKNECNFCHSDVPSKEKLKWKPS